MTEWAIEERRLRYSILVVIALLIGVLVGIGIYAHQQEIAYLQRLRDSIVQLQHSLIHLQERVQAYEATP